MMTMMMSENLSSQVHVTAIRFTEDLVVRASLNRLPIASMHGGGAQFSPNTSHVIGNEWSMRHSWWVIRLTWRTKFHILQQICSTQYFTILFWDWGQPGSIPGDTEVQLAPIPFLSRNYSGLTNSFHFPTKYGCFKAALKPTVEGGKKGYRYKVANFIVATVQSCYRSKLLIS
jgi:hypothetical protein